MYILNRFDNDQNLTSDKIELRYAKQSIVNILPDLHRDVVISQIRHKEMELDELLSSL